MSLRARSGRSAGFSLLELIIVLALALVIAAFAVPNIFNAIANMRLRSSAASMASMLQEGRMLAVKRNIAYTVQIEETTINDSPVTLVYIDQDNDQERDDTEPSVQIASSAKLAFSGNPSIDSMDLGFEPQATTVMPSFNSRGLPCVRDGAVCNTIAGGAAAGFVYFMQDERTFGDAGWVAVSVTPAGRVKVWRWSGSRWQS